MTAYSLESWLNVRKGCFCFSHTPPFSTQSCFSALDRDVLKKAIDKVTCWIAAAEEEETMILQDLSGMKQNAFE